MPAYVPRFRREQQQQAQEVATENNNQQQQQDALLLTQLQDQWKLMHRSINAAVNKVTVENIELTADDLFQANIKRGRGIFCTVISNAQLVSPHLTDVFAALTAKINSRVPEVGELLLRRLLRQLWQQLRLRNNEQVKNTCIFLSHLTMAQVCSVVVVLKLLALFLCSSGVSTPRILVAAAVFAETYEFLERDYPEAFAAVLEPARELVESGQLDGRSEEALDGVLKMVRQHQMKKERDAKTKNNTQGQFQQQNKIGGAGTSAKSKQELEEEKSNKRKQEILKAMIDEASQFGQVHEEVDVDLSTPPPDAQPDLDKFPSKFFNSSSNNNNNTKNNEGSEETQRKNNNTPQDLSLLWKQEDEEYFGSEEIQQVKLGEEKRRELEERVAAVAQTQIPRGRAEEEAAKQNLASAFVVTPNDFQGLADVETAKARQEIFLAFQSSIRSEEIVHKLLGTVSALATKGGVGGNTQKAIQRQQQLIVSMVIQLGIKEKSFDALYANVADLLCRSSASSQQSYRLNFEEGFRIAYRSADKYVRRELNILASIYASLFNRGSIDWCCLDVVDLRSPSTITQENPIEASDDNKSSSQRIFLEDFLKDLSAAMSLSKLADKLHFDEGVTPHVKKMFPKDRREDSQWAAAFYLSIGMRALASVLEENL